MKKKRNLSPKQRVLSPSPEWAKKLNALAIVLGGLFVIISKQDALPLIVVQWAGYFATICGTLATFSLYPVDFDALDAINNANSNENETRHYS